jgi:hypothetical protein
VGGGGEEDEVAGDGNRLNGKAAGYERWVVEEDTERWIRRWRREGMPSG